MKKQSAKKHYDMLKGAGYSEEDAKSSCDDGIKKGFLEDDLASEEDKKDLEADKGTKKGDGDWKTASEALDGFLAKGLSPEVAEAAVHDLIKSGAVEDDGSTAPDVSELDRIAQGLAKGADADGGEGGDAFDWLDDDDAPDAEDMALIKGLEMLPEIGEAIATLAGSQSALAKSSHASIAGLAKGLTDSVEKLNAKLEDLSERLEKGLGAPMPPRTPTGAKPQPSPQDEAESASGGGESKGDAALEKSALRADLMKQWAEAQRAESDMLVKGAYGDAIGSLRAYEDPALVKDRLESRVASLKRR